MDTFERTEQLRSIVIGRILECLDRTSHATLVELSNLLHKEPDIHKDIPLLQSVTLVDFLAKQLKDGNGDIITEQVMQEVYAYILDKLTQDKRRQYTN